VLAYVLTKLGYSVTAMHVNYCNRKTSDLEEEFVKKVTTALGIPCHVRRFSELTKGDIDREIYEEITKIARFDCYKRLKLPVVLGHHKDDALENIVTNISACKKWENLAGMEYKSVCMNVEIVRPFLGILKEEIFSFAKENGIPYLVDTTRPECMRYRLRNEFLPMADKFGASFGLHMLSQTMQDLFGLMEKVCDKIIRNMASDGNAILLCVPQNFPMVGWRHILFKLGVRDVSNRSLENLVWKLKRASRESYTHPLNSKWYASWNMSFTTENIVTISCRR
jgi:tRNA(Ile)-lysidine synthetase-like protein